MQKPCQYTLFSSYPAIMKSRQSSMPGLETATLSCRHWWRSISTSRSMPWFGCVKNSACQKLSLTLLHRQCRFAGNYVNITWTNIRNVVPSRLSVSKFVYHSKWAQWKYMGCKYADFNLCMNYYSYSPVLRIVAFHENSPAILCTMRVPHLKIFMNQA